MAWTISSAAAPWMPCRAIPARSFVSTSAMRRSLRLKTNSDLKTIKRERGDGVDDLLGGGAVDALPRHPRAQLRLDLGHEALAPLEAERAPQLLGLRRREAGRHHRHPQQLLLEQRHAERAAQ